MKERSAALYVFSLICAGCTSLGDLDAAASGSKAGAAGRESGSLAGAGSPGSSGTLGTGASASGGVSAMSGGTSSPSGGSRQGGAASVSGGTASPNGGSGGAGGAGTASGGVASGASGGSGVGGSTNSGGASNVGGNAVGGGSAGTGGASAGGVGAGGAGAGTGGTTTGPLPELPIELPDPPVNGQITFSADATWEVNGKQEPTFEIHTPSASYWVVKSLGSIVSIMDAAATDARQWIAYSTSFRPLRSVPSFGSFGAAPQFTTVLDTESQTPRHVRLLSETASKDWKLVWDFYLSHVTITVNRAPVPYGFGYRGVPGGALDDLDSFLSSEGVVGSAQVSRIADFPGPSEWASLADGSLNRALFLIQHGDDAISDRYQVKDSDSAMILFGDGKLMQVPLRFSLGLVESADSANIRARVAYVVGAIQ